MGKRRNEVAGKSGPERFKALDPDKQVEFIKAWMAKRRLTALWIEMSEEAKSKYVYLEVQNSDSGLKYRYKMEKEKREEISYYSFLKLLIKIYNKLIEMEEEEQDE